MSVLINMEMPKSCDDCKLRMAVGCCGNLPHNTRMPNCPLVELPPHGRLIDGDLLLWVLANKDVKFESYEDWEKLCDYIRAAPTIIPAEEGDT